MGQKKLLFISLVTAVSFFAVFILISFWFLPALTYESVKFVFGGLLFSVVVFILWMCSSLLIKILCGKNLPFFKGSWGITAKAFLPFIILIGRLAGISKRRIRSSFIAVNNEIVNSERKSYKADEILLLMPMCLQNSNCPRRLVFDLNKCERCGKCPVASLLELSEKYGIYLAIATGGTIARRIVYERRPKLIIACACERDLTSGIQDTYPIPVYGVLNERPNGPCVDTNVSIELLENTIKRFLG